MQPQASTTPTATTRITDLECRIIATSCFLGILGFITIKKPPLTLGHVIGGFLGSNMGLYLFRRKTIIETTIQPTPPKKNIDNNIKS